MYIEGPMIVCSGCGSTEVVKTVRRFVTDSSWLVCLNCGHRGGEEKSPFAMASKSKTYKHKSARKVF